MNFGNLGTAQYYSTMAQDNTNAQNLKVQELQNQQQEYQMGQMKMQADQQQMAQQEQQQKFQTSEMAKLASSLESGGTEQQQAAIWSKAKTDALKSGYVDLAKQYGEEEQSLLKTAQEKQKLQKQEGIDDKSSAYTAYETALLSRKPEDILASQVAAQKAGLPIPKFGDKSQEESQRKIYMANVEGVKAEQEQEERIRKDKTDADERERKIKEDERHHREEERLLNLKERELALIREGKKAERTPSGYRYKDDNTLEPIPGGPADPATKMGKIGNRESVFISRVMTSANEAAKDLANVVKLPISSSKGILGALSLEPHHTLMGANAGALANEMTTQEVQSYNVLSSGFQRALAGIESSGLAPSGMLSSQMDAVIFKAGDSNLTKMQKLAQTRQIVEAGLETQLSNPRVPTEQQDHMRSVIKSIREAVPFTQQDIVRLKSIQEDNSEETMDSMMARMKKDGVGASGGHPTDIQDLLVKYGKKP